MHRENCKKIREIVNIGFKKQKNSKQPAKLELLTSRHSLQTGGTTLEACRILVLIAYCEEASVPVIVALEGLASGVRLEDPPEEGQHSCIDSTGGAMY